MKTSTYIILGLLVLSQCFCGSFSAKASLKGIDASTLEKKEQRQEQDIVAEAGRDAIQNTSQQQQQSEGVTDITGGEGNKVVVNDSTIIYAAIGAVVLMAIVNRYFTLRRLRLQKKKGTSNAPSSTPVDTTGWAGHTSPK